MPHSLVSARSLVLRCRSLARGAFALGALSACGTPPPPEVPPPPPTATVPADPAPAEPTPAAEPSASAAAPVATAPVLAASPPPADASAERSQKPIDMITARDAAFLIDYANSAPKQAAQAACEREAKGDPEKTGACLAKKREEFQADVLRFRKESETKTSLLVYKRSGSTLREISIGEVSLAEEGDNVRVKFTGRYKGARPIWRGRSDGTVSVPNDYSIEVDDPDLGHLRYDAKIGLVTE
jgi:hypothetical protein